MIRLIFLFYFAPLLSPGTDETVKYEDIRLAEALEKARSTDQLLFIQLKSECEECNAVADEGLSGTEITRIFENFICLRLEYESDDYKTICSKYRIFPNYPSSLFIDPQGNYLTSMRGKSTSNRNEYISLAARAMANRKKSPYKAYEDVLKEDKISKDSLKEYLILLNKDNFNIADLAEKYAGMVTLKELDDTIQLKFLIRTVPLINSNVFRLITNNVNYSKVWQSLPLGERLRINQQTILYSKEKAIRDKNFSLLMSVSNYARTTYGPDYKSGQRASLIVELEYHQALKNPYQYYRLAKRYYDSQIKNLNVDSVVHAEVTRVYKRPDGMMIKGGPLYSVGNQLNKMAFTLLKFTADKEMLGFALKLSELTLKYDSPSFSDTYARILYKMGAQNDAMSWQQKVLDLCANRHQPDKKFREILEQMKNGSLYDSVPVSNDQERTAEFY